MEISYMLLALTLTGIEAACCNIFFSTFMEKRFEKKRWVNGILLVFFSLVFFGFSLMLTEGYLLKAILAIGIIATIMNVLYKAGIGQIIFTSICYYGMLLATDSGLMIVVQYVLNQDMKWIMENGMKTSVLLIFCKAVLFLVVIMINRKFSREEDYAVLADNEWIRFLFFPIFTVAAILLFLVEEENGNQSMLFISFGLLAANFILFYLIKDFVRREKENRQLSLMQEQAKSQMELYESMKSTFQEQKTRVHEFRNHVDCIQGLLMEGQETKVMEYVSGLNETMENHMNYFNTENPIINAVINQKYRQAKDKGIAIVLVLDNLSKIDMQEEDLVVLLANLLNNAIEACERIEEEQRLIKFKFVQSMEKTVISIKNPVKEPIKIVNDQIKTIKENEQEHGIGMQNIKNVVKKYHGEGIYTYNQGYFCYTIVFEGI